MTIYYSFHEGGRFFKIETEVSRKEIMREICANWEGNYSQVLGIKVHAVYVPGFSGAVRFDAYNGFMADGGTWTDPQGVVHQLTSTYESLSDTPIFDPDIHDPEDTCLRGAENIL